MTNQPKNILISLDERFADRILRGDKKVELRNRKMNLSEGDRVWIYSKLPRGCVAMVAVVKSIDEDSPVYLWDRYREVSGVDRDEFFSYFSGVTVGYAISLHRIEKLLDSVSLEKLRETDKNFHPPQFGKYLMKGTPILAFLESFLVNR